MWQILLFLYRKSPVGTGLLVGGEATPLPESGLRLVGECLNGLHGARIGDLGAEVGLEVGAGLFVSEVPLG